MAAQGSLPRIKRRSKPSEPHRVVGNLPAERGAWRSLTCQKIAHAAQPDHREARKPQCRQVQSNRAVPTVSASTCPHYGASVWAKANTLAISPPTAFASLNDGAGKKMGVSNA